MFKYIKLSDKFEEMKVYAVGICNNGWLTHEWWNIYTYNNA